MSESKSAGPPPARKGPAGPPPSGASAAAAPPSGGGSSKSRRADKSRRKKRAALMIQCLFRRAAARRAVKRLRATKLNDWTEAVYEELVDNEDSRLCDTMMRTHIPLADLSDLDLGKVGVGGGAHREFEVVLEYMALNKSLTRLDLSGNMLCAGGDVSAVLSIAEHLRRSFRLKFLNLGGNKVNDRAASALGASARVNSGLETLVLHEARLPVQRVRGRRKEDKEAFAVDLFSYRLVSVDCVFVCELLKGNPTMRRLDLHHNHVGPRGGEAVADLMRSNDGLVSLDVSSAALCVKGNEAGLDAICRAMRGRDSDDIYSDNNAGAGGGGDVRLVNDSITFLNLADNYINEDSVKAIATAMDGDRALRVLNLAQNWIGYRKLGVDNRQEGCRRLLRVLEGHPTLESLNLSKNHLAPPAIRSIAALLAHPRCVLTSLDVGKNAELGCEGALAIARAIQRSNTSLESLSLDEFPLPVKDLQGKRNGIRMPATKLVFRNKKLGVQDCVAIGELIRGNRHLHSLDLTNNHICGVQKLSGMAPGTLAGSYDDSGIVQLSIALKENATLENLGLDGNFLRESSKAVLKEAADANDHLDDGLDGKKEVEEKDAHNVGMVQRMKAAKQAKAAKVAAEKAHHIRGKVGGAGAKTAMTVSADGLTRTVATVDVRGASSSRSESEIGAALVSVPEDDDGEGGGGEQSLGGQEAKGGGTARNRGGMGEAGEPIRVGKGDRVATQPPKRKHRRRLTVTGIELNMAAASLERKPSSRTMDVNY